MAPKKPSLAAALHEASGKKTPPPEPEAQEQTAAEAGKAQPPSRQQTKMIGGHYDRAVSRQFRQIALDENKTGQELLAEALNDLFVKYGKKPIA